MVTPTRWIGAALALAAAGCGGGGDGDAATPVDCAWLAGDNCWRASAAAATECTDAAATGTLDAATTTCSYPDGTTVLFDPSASLTTRLALLQQGQRTLWDFTVVSSTAETCARYVDTDTSQTLTTRLGTFSLGWSGLPAILTCPDGSRFAVPESVVGCAGDLLGWQVSVWPQTRTTEFVLNGAPPLDDVLWRCR
jgi:hypothetical protein